MFSVLSIMGLFAAMAAGAMTAQIAPVQLTIEPATLIRGRTAIVDISLQIPTGYFIPAETRGSLKGAWLQPDSPWLSRGFPTYPIPDSARLPGSDARVFAYSGKWTVRMPVDVPPGVTGPNELGVRFGYQLCDSRACGAFATLQSTANFNVEESPQSQDRLAYRVDSQRVVIVTEMLNALTSEPSDLIRPLAQLIPQVAILPEGHEARSRFAGDLRMGARWTIASNGSRYAAIAEQPAIVSWRGGGNEAPLAVMARVTDTKFVKERAKYFVASPNEQTTNQQPLSIDLQLDEMRRRELEELLDRQMRITLPSVLAPVAYIQNPAAQPKETEYDRQLQAGKGRVVYHLEAFQLAPDQDPRLYVRAYWKIGARAHTGLTLWLRFDGQHFSVEQTDATISRLARYLEFKNLGPQLAAQPEYAGMLLNIVPAADGWAYVIMGRRGYESAVVSVWKYSSAGPRDTGIAYSYGC